MGIPKDGAPPRCAESRYDFLGQCQPRFEAVRCYVPNDGEACMPANDKQLLMALANQISSIGFAAEFVLDEADVTPECNKLLACCESLPAQSQSRCYDAIEYPNPLDCSPDKLQNYGCNFAEPEDAGADGR